MLTYSVNGEYAMHVAWDLAKNCENLEKHGIPFEEASELLLGTVDHLVVFDAAHSDEEDRFVAIGPIARGVIVVDFTECDDETVRIMNAREARKRAKRGYEAWKAGAVD